MKRSELLYLADCDTNRLKLLRRRDHMPFVVGNEHTDRNEGFAEYSLDDAFRLRLMLDIVGGTHEQVSIPPGDAANMVVNCFSEILRRGLPHPLNLAVDDDIWVGKIEFEAEEYDGTRYRSSVNYAGPWDDIGVFMRSFMQSSGGEKICPVRPIIVNATRAARFVRHRAEELGLPERFGLYDDWGA